MKPIKDLDLPVEKFKSGKVREMFDLGDSFLMVATDRLSAFDRVIPDPIPYKGAVLNQISLFWFDFLKDTIGNHVLISDFEKYPEELKGHPELKDRSVIVKKAEPIPVECIVRGYLSGSGWRDYQKTGEVCGIKLPEGLKKSDKLPEPIFTPSTKAEKGDHDENIGFDSVVKQVGQETADFLKEKSLEIYKKASDFAREKGIIIADTKFEFGKIDDKIILIDEVLTPDSSRFWPADKYSPGGSQPSFDKQYVRDYLEETGWNKEPPAPELPDEIIENTTKKYLEAYEKLTGKKLK
ncbi:MAG: phosphoribosylaminoimidazolesuccinocarboxamide synthase [Candidatus Undinarchaeales archaeon]